MSLTPVEVAMCRDALLEAGVPDKIVEAFVGLPERVRVIRATYLLPYYQAISADSDLKEDVWARLWGDAANKLNENGFGSKTMISTHNLDAVEYALKLYVLTPPEWTQPAKVQR